jgi:4-hydroxy-tetrahydrodipicolinate reductase
LGLALTSHVSNGLEHADVAIDFSIADAVDAHLAACAAAGVGLVIGTTGLAAETLRAVEEASQRIPVLVAANTSLGINLLSQLIEKTALSCQKITTSRSLKRTIATK